MCRVNRCCSINILFACLCSLCFIHHLSLCIRSKSINITCTHVCGVSCYVRLATRQSIQTQDAVVRWKHSHTHTHTSTHTHAHTHTCTLHACKKVSRHAVVTIRQSAHACCSMHFGPPSLARLLAPFLTPSMHIQTHTHKHTQTQTHTHT